MPIGNCNNIKAMPENGQITKIVQLVLIQNGDQ